MVLPGFRFVTTMNIRKILYRLIELIEVYLYLVETEVNVIRFKINYNLNCLFQYSLFVQFKLKKQNQY